MLHFSLKNCLTVAIMSLMFVDLGWAQFVNWNNVGLERSWKFQAPTDPAKSGDVSVALFVSRQKRRTVYEVSYPDGPASVFVAGQVDSSGNRLDAESAAFQADVELRTLKALGHDDAKMETQEVPDVSLLIQTGSGQLLLVDGETGELRWDLSVGKPHLTNQSPAIGERYVAAVNGSTLYILNVETGKLEQEHRLRGIADSGPAIAGEQLLVPTLGRPIEVFSLADGQLHAPSKFRASFGMITNPPLVTPAAVTWATDRGYVFLANPITGISEARIEARSGIVGSPAFVPPGQLVVSVGDGYVLSVGLDNQLIEWEYFTGETLTESPYAMDGTVYVPSAENTLFALDALNGQLKWTAPGAARVISGMGDRLFCVDASGLLKTLDVADGRQLYSMPLARSTRVLSNAMTDRIYLISADGMLECVRPAGARWPTLRVPVDAKDGAEKPETSSTEEQPDASPGDAPADTSDVDDLMGDEPDSNPFAENNPFADATPLDEDGADVPEDGMNDDDNPFDTGDEDDPFGDTGDDPFG